MSTLTHITRDETAALAESRGWSIEADGPFIWACKNRTRLTITFPTDDPYQGAPESVKVSYELTDGTWNEVTLATPDVDGALEDLGQESMAPFTEWALEHGYHPNDRSQEVRWHWHYSTGTGDPGDWEDVPAEWGEFDGWRSRAAR